jgi:hypothetical protein
METATRARLMYVAAGCFFLAAIIGFVSAYSAGASMVRSFATVGLPVVLSGVMISVARRRVRG